MKLIYINSIFFMLCNVAPLKSVITSLYTWETKDKKLITIISNRPYDAETELDQEKNQASFLYEQLQGISRPEGQISCLFPYERKLIDTIKGNSTFKNLDIFIAQNQPQKVHLNFTMRNEMLEAPFTLLSYIEKFFFQSHRLTFDDPDSNIKKGDFFKKNGPLETYIKNEEIPKLPTRKLISALSAVLMNVSSNDLELNEPLSHMKAFLINLDKTDFSELEESLLCYLQLNPERINNVRKLFYDYARALKIINLYQTILKSTQSYNETICICNPQEGAFLNELLNKRCIIFNFYVSNKPEFMQQANDWETLTVTRPKFYDTEVQTIAYLFGYINQYLKKQKMIYCTFCKEEYQHNPEFLGCTSCKGYTYFNQALVLPTNAYSKAIKTY